jgi:hypothetical protein
MAQPSLSAAKVRSGALVATFILAALVVHSLASGSLGAGEARSFYLIGNSLTQDTVPSRLDGDVQWHVDCGKSLPYIFENPQEPCVKNSTIWPEALRAKQYDLVSVQVHYGGTVETDAAVLSEFVRMQPKAVFVIHSGWARSRSRAEEYAGAAADGTMLHSPAYIGKLLALLRAAHPGREFRETRAQDLLAWLAEDVAAGKAPFTTVEEIYRDDIHLDRVTGRYLMHNAMRHALGQPRSVAGFEEIASPVKAYLDGLLDRLPPVAAAASAQ